MTKSVFNKASFRSLQVSDNSRKVKTQHLNNGKLDLTVLSNFVNEISKVLHWQIDRGNSNANVEGCNFKGDLTAKVPKILVQPNTQTIRGDNVNKLIFAHLKVH